MQYQLAGGDGWRERSYGAGLDEGIIVGQREKPYREAKDLNRRNEPLESKPTAEILLI